MIPKTIHYCWFGRGEKPAKVQKCIESWKKFCPDYEIIEWNEDNFDIHKNGYTEYCYENKKYAFLSDYVRLLVVEENGGVYFDTDVEVLKSFDSLLENKAYFGFETDEYVNTGIGFGAVSGHCTVKAMIDEYTPLLDGEHGVIGCPHLNTDALEKLGLVRNGCRQNVAGAEIYPIDFFNPYDDPTGRLKKTENTYSIHWFAKSWQSKQAIIRSMLTKPLHRILGANFMRRNNNAK